MSKADPELHDGNRLLQVAEGLQILARVTEDKFSLCAEHDIIYAGGEVVTGDEDEEIERTEDKEIRDTRLSEEEQKRMQGLGWFVDESTNSWAFFP